jgi:hypothetical protein
LKNLILKPEKEPQGLRCALEHWKCTGTPKNAKSMKIQFKSLCTKISKMKEVRYVISCFEQFNYGFTFTFFASLNSEIYSGL